MAIRECRERVTKGGPLSAISTQKGRAMIGDSAVDKSNGGFVRGPANSSVVLAVVASICLGLFQPAAMAGSSCREFTGTALSVYVETRSQEIDTSPIDDPAICIAVEGQVQSISEVTTTHEGCGDPCVTFETWMVGTGTVIVSIDFYDEGEPRSVTSDPELVNLERDDWICVAVGQPAAPSCRGESSDPSPEPTPTEEPPPEPAPFSPERAVTLAAENDEVARREEISLYGAIEGHLDCRNAQPVVLQIRHNPHQPFRPHLEATTDSEGSYSFSFPAIQTREYRAVVAEGKCAAAQSATLTVYVR